MWPEGGPATVAVLVTPGERMLRLGDTLAALATTPVSMPAAVSTTSRARDDMAGFSS